MRLQVIFPQSITFSTSNIGRKLTQSTLHMGSDTQTQSICKSKVCFNPRSHMGSDVLPGHTRQHFRRFNPRSHMGSDPPKLVKWGCKSVSIHAPTWGATKWQTDRSGDTKFQSTLPHGERPLLRLYPASDFCVSIHAPTWGATVSAYHGSVQVY